MKILTTKEYKEISQQITHLTARVQQLTFSDPRDSADSEYTGNAYKRLESGISEIAKKYSCEADWGNQIVGAIIGVRSAFISGKGAQVSPSGNATSDSEIEFAKAFCDYNGFLSEVINQFVIEQEIEGRAFVQLIWDKDATWTDSKGKEQVGMVRAQIVPWLTTKYEVETDPKDYQRFVSAKGSIDGKDASWKENEFSYRPFGGRIAQPNKPIPKVLPVLTECENLGRALRDWREINNFFATPTPVNTLPESAEQKDIEDYQAFLEEINWKVGNMLVTNGKFEIISPTLQGVLSLKEEITTLAKIISGATGVPVHFLGLPDLMSNRSTAENLMELVWAATTKERQIWTGLLQELVDKAISMRNDKSKLTQLKPGLVTISIPDISEDAMEKLTKLYLPMNLAGKLSDETLLSKCPDIDVQEELARILKQKKENMETFGGNLFGDKDDDKTQDDKNVKTGAKSSQKTAPGQDPGTPR